MMKSQNETDVNIFRSYKQEENRFTNGLISILDLSKIEDNSFVNKFFQDTLSIQITPNIDFKVLRDIEEGTPDVEISNNEICFYIEAKIILEALKMVQIDSHIRSLTRKKQSTKKLILLTPDNSKSGYIKQFTDKKPDLIVHLEWKKVYNYLDGYAKQNKSVFTEIISQYLSEIQMKIFEQDIIGVIAKIGFGDKSGVYPDKYLEEMRKGEWTDWGTPRLYKNLDGQGRKLILYDPKQEALTVEVEIKNVKKEEGEYPWRNKFVPNSLKIYEKPIPVSKLEEIDKFRNFKKGRAPYWNLTHEQYEELIKYSE